MKDRANLLRRFSFCKTSASHPLNVSIKRLKSRFWWVKKKHVKILNAKRKHKTETAAVSSGRERDRVSSSCNCLLSKKLSVNGGSEKRMSKRKFDRIFIKKKRGNHQYSNGIDLWLMKSPWDAVWLLRAVHRKMDAEPIRWKMLNIEWGGNSYHVPGKNIMQTDLSLCKLQW